MTRTSFVVVALVAMLGLPASAATGQSPAGAPSDAAPQPVPADLPDIVARVNGEAITKGDLESAVAQLESRAGRSVPAEERDRVLRGVLEQLVAYRLLAQESAKRQVAVPEAEIDARVTELRGQFPSEDVFRQALEEQKMTEADLRDSVRRGLQINGLIESEIASRLTVTPDQVNAFYTSNSFEQGERVRASHILIAVPEGAGADVAEQARARAADVLKQVQAGGDFAALAKEHSQDPGSAPGGGDLGYFERGQMVPPFEAAAFALAAGQASELVQTQFGYHIIKVLDKQAARTIPLEEVRGRIEEYLKDQNREQQTERFIDSLRAQATVEIAM